MEKHIDAAEVVGGDVNLLTVKAQPDVFLAENFGKIQEQGTGTAGRVIDFIDFRFPH
ncbi:MAG: hypothetical protein DDT40_01572 [candidate division WS2 bacterium]|nr:hypothetical protein [Candidatus Psychracetigena formicireducens]